MDEHGAPQSSYPTYGNPFAGGTSYAMSNSMTQMPSFAHQPSSIGVSDPNSFRSVGVSDAASFHTLQEAMRGPSQGNTPQSAMFQPGAYTSSMPPPSAPMLPSGFQSGAYHVQTVSGAPMASTSSMRAPVYMQAPHAAASSYAASRAPPSQACVAAPQYMTAPASAPQYQQQAQHDLEAIHADDDVMRFEPEYYERIVEVPKIEIENIERIVEVPQPQIVDRIVEIPQVQEVITELPGPVDVQIVTREVPKIEVRTVERIVEVPQIEYQDRVVEVPEIHEIVRRIPRIEVHEIPIERIIKVPKKIYQEVEQPVFRPVPHLVRQAVERDIPVAKTQVQTVEVVKQVAVPTYQGAPVSGYAPPTYHVEAQQPPPQNWYSTASQASMAGPPPSLPVMTSMPPSMPMDSAPQAMTSMAASSYSLGPPSSAVMGKMTPPTPPVPAATAQSIANMPVGSQVLVKKGSFTPPGSVANLHAPGVTSSVRSMASQVLSYSQPAATSVGSSSVVVQRPGWSTPPTPPVVAASGPLGSQQLASPMQSGLVSGSVNYPARLQSAGFPMPSYAQSMPAGSVHSMQTFGSVNPFTSSTGSAAAPQSQVIGGGGNPFASAGGAYAPGSMQSMGPPQSGYLPPGSSRMAMGGTPPTPPNGGGAPFGTQQFGTQQFGTQHFGTQQFGSQQAMGSMRSMGVVG